MACDTDSLSGSVLMALYDDVEPICLVRECREMKEGFSTHFTNSIISKEVISIREMKNVITDVDNNRIVRCKEKTPMIVRMAEAPGWLKVWDHGMDLGWKAVLGLKMLSRGMSYHGRGEHPCHLCDAASI